MQILPELRRWCTAVEQQFLHRLGGLCTTGATPVCGKTHSRHRHRRTASSASEHVTPGFPGRSTRPDRSASGRAWYTRATTVSRPNRHGAARGAVLRPQPRVVPGPSSARSS
jgi:hypothetical protein